MQPRGCRSAWCRAWIGWTLGVGLAARFPPVPPAPPPVRTVALEAIDLPTAGDWRAVPGIGEQRALDLARAWWSSQGADEEFDPQAVPGIGDELGARARAFLGSRAADSSHGTWAVH
ncbi:MAG: hypothetical protein O2816_10770 [Planctomycetota bacterium]|nr:hypothetical protein [Planctomycetota bacterium]